MLYEVITGRRFLFLQGSRGGRRRENRASRLQEDPRITSYNVCYTKLLRVAVSGNVVRTVRHEYSALERLIDLLYYELAGGDEFFRREEVV